jgi:threonine aldolase
MWAAMRNAPLGWAVVGEDHSVRDLESEAAEITGKEAALFIPTGSMANLVALLSHTSAGDQIILEASSHILWMEEWSFASLCGLVARPIPGVHGYIDPEAVLRAIQDQRASRRPKTSLICLEDTHNAAGGAVFDRTQLAAIASVAHAHQIPLHLDGARLFNACVALGVDARDLVAEVDTLAVSLNKGLSAPEGSVLCGSAAFIERSRYQLRRLAGIACTKLASLLRLVWLRCAL